MIIKKINAKELDSYITLKKMCNALLQGDCTLDTFVSNICLLGESDDFNDEIENTSLDPKFDQFLLDVNLYVEDDDMRREFSGYLDGNALLDKTRLFVQEISQI